MVVQGTHLPVQLLLPRVGSFSGFLSSGRWQCKEKGGAVASMWPQWHLFTLTAG